MASLEEYDEVKYPYAAEEAKRVRMTPRDRTTVDSGTIPPPMVDRIGTLAKAATEAARAFQMARHRRQEAATIFKQTEEEFIAISSKLIDAMQELREGEQRD